MREAMWGSALPMQTSPKSETFVLECHEGRKRVLRDIEVQVHDMAEGAELGDLFQEAVVHGLHAFQVEGECRQRAEGVQLLELQGRLDRELVHRHVQVQPAQLLVLRHELQDPRERDVHQLVLREVQLQTPQLLLRQVAQQELYPVVPQLVASMG